MIDFTGPYELTKANPTDAVHTVRIFVHGNSYGIGRLLISDLYAVIVYPTSCPIDSPRRELENTSTKASHT